MSTNYYFFTENRFIADLIGDYELVAIPSCGYLIHIGKASCGWLPLFQAHKGIRSVKAIKKLAKCNEITILDEYNKEYTAEELDKNLIKWNGGYDGAIEKQPYIQPHDSPFYDKDMPEYIPVSHFTYGRGKYAHCFFKDSEGYEFSEGDFV